MSVQRIAALGYTAGGDDYEAARPTYPAAAIDLLIEQLDIRAGARVLDLGAGTGKLTRLLRPTGAALIAVEPVAAMLGHLAVAAPWAQAVAGTAEAIPLADRCVDAALVGTAFHWFDGARALAELARVLRPGGGLGLVWNNPDLDVDWVARVWGVAGEYRRGAPRNRDLRWREAFEHTSVFTPLQHRRFSHRQEIGLDDLLARITSISFVAILPPPERADVLARVRDIAATHPNLSGRDRFPLPYRTDAYWCRKRPAPH